MERVGERLRRRREELGFTIEDISRATRYRPDTIRAVEEGRSGVFPAEAYRQAFLRAYAEKLNLDAGEIVREQKSEEERIQEALKGIRVRPRRRTNFRRTIVWLAVVIGAAAAVLVLYDRVIKVRRVSGPVEDAERVGGGAAEGAGMPGADSLGDSPSDSLHGGPAVEGDQGEPVGSDESSESDPSGGPPEDGAVADREEGPPGAAEDLTLGVREAGGESAPAPEVASAAPAEGSGPGSGGLECLEVSVTGYAVRARLFAGDSLLVGGWLRSGFQDTFCSHAPFWADTIITQTDAMVLVLNGERVNLPRTRDNVITDFRISP